MIGYWVCDACKSLNDPRYGACYKCHVKRGQAKPVPIIPGATVGPAPSEFYGTGGRVAPEPSAVTALLFGLIAAMLATGAWYWLEAEIRFGSGRLALFIGIVIAFTVILAGTHLGHRRVSYILPVISFVLALGAVVVGEYLIISTELARAAGVDTAGAIPVATPEDVAQVVGDYLGSDPFRPILWFLALAAAWLIPWVALVGSDGPDPDRKDWSKRH